MTAQHWVGELFVRQLQKITAAFVATIVVMCGFSAVARAEAPTDELSVEVGTYVEPLVRTNNFAGVIVIAEAGEIRLARGFGYANVEQQVANLPETRFQIASISKPFTSAAILLLAERGKLDLQAPLSVILPGYPHGDELTVHHLLSHRSGIPNINDFPEYEQIQMKAHTTEELVAYFRDKPLEFAPGERFDYSNSNYNLLAHIIERVSGQSYGEFLGSELLRPLSLSDTGHRARMTDIIAGLASGYAPEGPIGLQRGQHLDWTVKTGNGSLYSSAHDLVRFVRAVHGSQFLSAASRSALFTQHSQNVGYGWFVTEANGKQIHHINGRSPGWSAQLDHYVDEDVTVVVLSNTYSAVTTPIARAVGAIYYGQQPKPMPALKSQPLSDVEADRLTGTYRFGPDYYIPDSIVTITSKAGYIQAEYPSDYPASPYVPISPTKFIVRPFWMPAEFVIGPDGKAAELVLDGFKGLRVR